MLTDYLVDVEVHTPKGRVGIVLLTKTNLDLIELKLNQDAQTAMQQINFKNYPQHFALSEKPICIENVLLTWQKYVFTGLRVKTKISTTNKSINYVQRLIGTLVNNMELRNYMKTNKIMDSIRKTTPENTNKQVDFGVAIANRVYDLLKERNMTQRDFAKALNKTETEVSRWLSGTHNLTLSSIAKMATVLGDDIITTTHTLRPYKIPDVEQYATSVAEEIHT